MKIRAWNDENTSEPTLYVRLRQEGNRILVFLVDGEGAAVEKGNLLYLQAGNPVVRRPGVSPKYGFPLNRECQIRIHHLPEETPGGTT